MAHWNSRDGVKRKAHLTRNQIRAAERCERVRELIDGGWPDKEAVLILAARMGVTRTTILRDLGNIRNDTSNPAALAASLREIADKLKSPLYTTDQAKAELRKLSVCD